MEFRKILVPVSGTAADDEAVKLACKLAKKNKGKIWAVCIIPVKRMLPLDADVRLVDLGRARPALSLQVLVQQFYQLIKDAMLWLPVGFIFAIGGQQRLMWAWLGALCGGLLLVLLPWFALWPLGLLASIGMAWAGLLSGAWLAGVSQPAVAGRARAAERAAMVQGEIAEVSGSSTGTNAMERIAVAAPMQAVESLGPVRSNQFRHREQAEGAAGKTPGKTAWRTRAAEDESAGGGRGGGFRSRSAASDKPSVDGGDES